MRSRSVLMTLFLIAVPALWIAAGAADRPEPSPAPATESVAAPSEPAPVTPEAGSLEADPFYSLGGMETAAPTCQRCRILAGRSCPGRPTGFACNDSGCICRKCKGTFDCFPPA